MKLSFVFFMSNLYWQMPYELDNNRQCKNDLQETKKAKERPCCGYGDRPSIPYKGIEW